MRLELPRARLGGQPGAGGTARTLPGLQAHFALLLFRSPIRHFGGSELPGGLQALQGTAQTCTGGAGMGRDSGTETPRC